MKNWLITLGLAVVVGVAAYGVFFVGNDEPELRRAARAGDAMAWLRVEFRLSDAQAAAVKKMHDDFSVECGEHCGAIVDARTRKAPAAEIARLEQVCVDAMTAHFERVAALMAPEQGARYLEIVRPRVAGYDHAGAPNVRVKP